MDKYYVVAGAQLKCDETQLPVARSAFFTLNLFWQIEGKGVGVLTDIVPLFNVLPFPSPCKILSALAGGVPTPCLPFPTPWQGTHADGRNMLRPVLLDTSTCRCAIGGCISVASAGQTTASYDGPLPPLPPVPARPTTIVAQRVPLQNAAAGPSPAEQAAQAQLDASWSTTLNQVPLVPNAQYLVGTSLYETDAEGRVVKVRGVLTLRPHGRNETEQTASVRKKDGRFNPGFVPDKRRPHEKKKKIAGRPNPNLKPDKRTWLQKRRYIDDGGHLRGDQFDGVGEQINYVPQHINQNQKRKNAANWFALESIWANSLKERPPKRVYTETTLEYPQAVGSSINRESMRPDTFGVQYWTDGKFATKILENQ